MTNAIMTFLRELEKQIKEIREQLTRIETTQKLSKQVNYYDSDVIFPFDEQHKKAQPGGAYDKCGKCKIPFKDMTNYACGIFDCPLRATISVTQNLDLRLKDALCKPGDNK